MRDTPWFHPRRSESAPPVEREREPPTMSQKQQDEITDRISRPTESAMYRQSLYWKLDGYMDRGFHSWSKMDLFDDCKRCMWTPEGTIKPSCKIRPLRTSASSGDLPPLRSGRGANPFGGNRGSSREAANGANTSRIGCESYNLASGRRGNETCRSSRGSEAGYITTTNKSAMANGLAMLGGLRGSRYTLHNHHSNGARSSQYPASIQSLAVPRVGQSFG